MSEHLDRGDDDEVRVDGAAVLAVQTRMRLHG
jgi:hypothetical protein